MAIVPFDDLSFTPREELIQEVAALLHDLLVSGANVHVVEAASKILDVVDRAEYVPSDDFE